MNRGCSRAAGERVRARPVCPPAHRRRSILRVLSRPVCPLAHRRRPTLCVPSRHSTLDLEEFIAFYRQCLASDDLVRAYANRVLLQYSQSSGELVIVDADLE